MEFSTLRNYFRKLFEILGVVFRDVLAETTTGRCSLKKADPDFDRIQEEW